MRYAILYIVVMLISGCAEPGVQELWYTTSQDLLGPARAAGEAWCEASDGEYCPEVLDTQSDSAAAIVVLSQSRGKCGWYRSRYMAVAGSAEQIGVSLSLFRPGLQCFVPDLTRDENLQLILAHEMGHAVGLHHRSEPCVMAPTIGDMRMPTPADWPW
jgi:hypothetical protein